MAPALRLAPDICDPLKLYRLDEKRGALCLRYVEERALWRDSAALFRLRRGEASGGLWRPPASLLWIYELLTSGILAEEDLGTRPRLVAFGMANDQAKIHFYREDRLPLRAEYLQDEIVFGHLERLLDLAEAVCRQLWGAAQTMARLSLSPEADQKGGREPAPEDVSRLMASWAVERDYWSQLEIPFLQIMAELPDDPPAGVRAWRDVLSRVAWDAFQRVADDLAHDMTKLKATVRASRQLAMGQGKVLQHKEMVPTNNA
jgi:hypothetical protein